MGSSMVLLRAPGRILLTGILFIIVAGTSRAVVEDEIIVFGFGNLIAIDHVRFDPNPGI
jgi:hypothetical protein